MAEEKPKPVPAQQRRWHWTTPPQAGGPGTPTYWKRVFKLAAVLMALIGAFLAWLMFWEKVKPPIVLAIPVTQYDDLRWPPNDYADRDYQALRDNHHFQEGKERTADKQKAFASQVKTRLIGELKSLNTPEGNDRSVVIFLWSLARTGPGGEVFLLPADARPEAPDSWVSLREILKLVEEFPAPHKLLVLDLARPMADPRLGILANDVADRVTATLESRHDLPFFVLTSCGRAQVSLAAPELGRSVFGYYLDEGLLGQADLYNDAQERDGRVMVHELARFVKARVDRWAHSHGTAQTPQLYGHAKDFALVRVHEVRPPTLTDPPAYSPRLRAGWSQWHEWWKDETYRLTPGVFRRLEGLLLRAEHRLPYDPVKADEELAREFDHLKELVARVKKPALPRPRSLAVLAVGRDPKGVDEVAKGLDEVAAALDKEDKAKQPAALAKARKDLAAKYKGREVDVALAVWRLVIENKFEAHPLKRVRQLVPLLQAVQPVKSPFVETLFLERLAELKPEADPMIEAAVRDALQVVEQAEAAVSDPCVFTWTPIRDMLESASQKRVAAERLLFDTDPRKQKEALAGFREALAEFQAVGNSITTIQEGRRTLDRAQIFLPSYVPFLMKSLEQDLSENPEKVWLQAVEAVCSLDQDLTGTTGDFTSRMDRVRVRTAEIKGFLAELKQAVTWREIRRLTEDSSEANLHRLDALLELPWFRIDGADAAPAAGDKEKRLADREEFWKKRQEMAQQVQHRTLKYDEADNQNLQATRTSGPMDIDAALRQENKRAARRARISLELLRLGGAPAVKTLDSVANPDPVAAGADRWNQRGQVLAAVWSRLPEQIDKSLGKDPVAADRLSRVVDPLNSDWPWEPVKAKKNPALQLREGELTAFCKWLAEDYRQKSQKLPGRFQEFYKAAADDYANAPAAFFR